MRYKQARNGIFAFCAIIGTSSCQSDPVVLEERELGAGIGALAGYASCALTSASAAECAMVVTEGSVAAGYPWSRVSIDATIFADRSVQSFLSTPDGIALSSEFLAHLRENADESKIARSILNQIDSSGALVLVDATIEHEREKLAIFAELKRQSLRAQLEELEREKSNSPKRSALNMALEETRQARLESETSEIITDPSFEPLRSFSEDLRNGGARLSGG